MLFSVETTSRFDREYKKLFKKHTELPQYFAEVINILSFDPHNITHLHAIKKLKDVKDGDGQYRLRLWRFRFRYDIVEKKVILKYCGLRREDTY